ncbi:MAG: hypothetical protein V7780_06855 [Colwellia sp.]|jgi:hypothetical protein
MDPILSGILGVLVGGLIGHRLALGRDKRKEFNDCIFPLREKLLHQIDKLSAQNFDHGIDDKEITKLIAVLGERKTKQISLVYKEYSEARNNSGVKDEWHQFTINEIGFNLFQEQSKKLLKTMLLK